MPDKEAPADGPLARDNGTRARPGSSRLEDVSRLARVVGAVDSEREALERDLHDGVQQRLVAIRIRLAIAGELGTGDPRLPRVLSQLREDLDEAIDELREVARGVHPQILTDHGLVAALAQVARLAAGPVDVATTGSVATRLSWNRRSITAAARRSRTRRSTAGRRCASRSPCTRTRTASASRCPTTGPASTSPPRPAARDCNTCATGSFCSAGACRSSRRPRWAPSFLVSSHPSDASAGPSPGCSTRVACNATTHLRFQRAGPSSPLRFTFPSFVAAG